MLTGATIKLTNNATLIAENKQAQLSIDFIKKNVVEAKSLIIESLVTKEYKNVVEQSVLYQVNGTSGLEVTTLINTLTNTASLAGKRNISMNWTKPIIPKPVETTLTESQFNQEIIKNKDLKAVVDYIGSQNPIFIGVTPAITVI